MTTRNPELASPAKPLTFAQRMINSMWIFWMLLLAISLGLATVVYYVWLRGNI